jgi:hypothetical protein
MTDAHDQSTPGAQETELKEVEPTEPEHAATQPKATDAHDHAAIEAGESPDSSHLAPPPNTYLHPNTSGSHGPSQATSSAPSIMSQRVNAMNPPTQVVFQDPDFANPPDLNYGLRSRKKSIAIFWTLIVLDCVAMPIALYFGLWYGTSLSHNAGR